MRKEGTFQDVKEEEWVSMGTMESLRKEERRQRDTEQGDEGEKSPPKEMQTDKYVGDDRKVSK